MKSIITISTLVLLAAGCNKVINKNNSNGTSQSSTTPAASTSSTPNFQIIHSANYDTFVSHDLGVSFQYENDDSGISVSETGNTVGIFENKSATPLKSLQVFSKDSNQDIQTALAQQLLQQYPNCEIKADGSQTQGTKETYQVYSLQPKAWDDTAAMQAWEKQNPNGSSYYSYHTEDCPQAYEHIGGQMDFRYYPAHPTKFFFIIAGEDAFPMSVNQTANSSGGQTDWSGTITIQ